MDLIKELDRIHACQRMLVTTMMAVERSNKIRAEDSEPLCEQLFDIRTHLSSAASKLIKFARDAHEES